MTTITISDECIGCEACVDACPDVFEMNKEGSHAVVKDPASDAPCVEDAIETCPVDCIERK